MVTVLATATASYHFVPLGVSIFQSSFDLCEASFLFELEVFSAYLCLHCFYSSPTNKPTTVLAASSQSTFKVPPRTDVVRSVCGTVALVFLMRAALTHSSQGASLRGGLKVGPAAVSLRNREFIRAAQKDISLCF